MTLGNPVASAVISGISAELLGYLLLIVVSVTFHKKHYKTYKFTNSGLQTLMIYLE